MRSSLRLLGLSWFVVIAFAACSSGSSNGAGGGPDGGPNTEAGATNPDGTPVVEAPLVAHPICATVPTGAKFGQRCSGSTTNHAICALSDPTCTTDACVYSETATTFDFYCASKCTVGDPARCPLGYECASPDAGCAGDAAAGVCVKQKGHQCQKMGVSSTLFIEGPAGELLHIDETVSSGQQRHAVLAIAQGSAFKQIAAWDSESSSFSNSQVRAGGTLLIVMPTVEVVVKDGAAQVVQHKAPTAAAVYSAGKDGSFLRLEPPSSEGYAALSRRGTDGAWTEVGPTQQKITRLAALNTGFVAICQATLCTSEDGVTFAPLSLPEGASLPAATADQKLVFAGASPGDFYLTTAGALYHQRKGGWVKEGPRALAPPPDAGTSTRADRLRASANGTIVYNTWTGTNAEYATYVSGASCWAAAQQGNLDAATFVKDSFVYVTAADSVCTVPAR